MKSVGPCISQHYKLERDKYSKTIHPEVMH
jgi:hypothetical protein